MRKIIEYTLVSLDGVFAGEGMGRFFEYRDDAYLRDGLGQLPACDAMLMGRNTYEGFAKLWPERIHPWADRLNAMPKYVFLSKLEKADWNNSTIIRGDVVAEVTKLKQQEGGDLLIWGHGLFGEMLLKQHLLDVLDLSVHPPLLGQGRPYFRDGRGLSNRPEVRNTPARRLPVGYSASRLQGRSGGQHGGGDRAGRWVAAPGTWRRS